MNCVRGVWMVDVTDLFVLLFSILQKKRSNSKSSFEFGYEKPSSTLSENQSANTCVITIPPQCIIGFEQLSH